MAAINLDNISGRFIAVARTFIGDKLARERSGTGTTPAIYLSRDPRPVRKYPSVTVTLSDVTNTDKLYEHYNAEGDLVTYSVHNILITYNVYSTNSSSHSAQQIAFDLYSKFTRRDVHRLFVDDGMGSVTTVYDITSNDFKSNNEVGEVASFRILFTAIHSETNSEYEIQQILMNIDEKYLGNEDYTITTIDIDTDLNL